MLLLPLLLLAACSPQSEAPKDEAPQNEAPRQVVERRESLTPAPRGAERLRTALLDAHNAARAAVKVPPLTWDEALARDAAAYARVLARSGKFEHAKQPRGPTAQGENLWKGTRSAYRYEEMAGHWVAERRDYLNRPIPNISATGRFVDAGHYAQIIWSRTTRVGCALASNLREDVLVCRYAPAGNVMGQVALP
ncbi:CAP domain-containing protein [Sphingomonas sp.]|uniref:CAP domain-containing protein n=1 Tax=Sphingomonas sp. TaxID=28214 RepID=UPI001795E170|nr:CAP domain-containing protein [Sphingomonas sp.]MBA4761035.1 serine protease [Sphingomonas sp.]